MKVFLGRQSARGGVKEPSCKYCCLMSYWECRKNKIDVSQYLDFILDSGVFTLVYGAGGKVDAWDYAKKYARYVNECGIKNYVELDLDKITGYEEVKKLRAFLKAETGRDPIPVWHISRGIDEFKRMCGEYEYASIGGLRQEIGIRRMAQLKRLTDYAREHGCRIHGMGYTRLAGPHGLNGDALGFYSVDSTTWNSPHKYGVVKFEFKDGKLETAYAKKNLQRCKLEWREAARQSLQEWARFSEWKAKQPYYMKDKNGKPARAY